jgi:hypothetical protein
MSPSMGNLRRFRGGLLRVLGVFLIVLACCWLALYLDSIHQRRRAERFLSDLRSFPFASAGFVEVRDLAIRHGGAGMQDIPPHFPPACTARHCTFAVGIKHPLAALSLAGRPAEFLYSALPYFGIRPWVVNSDFEVIGDRLDSSTTQIGQLRRGRLQAYEGLLPIMYQVRTERQLDMSTGSAGYRVGPPDGIEGPPQEVWLAWVPQTPDAPVSRVFDLDLRCFTAVFHGCTGYRELAPSAWADNQASSKK